MKVAVCVASLLLFWKLEDSHNKLLLKDAQHTKKSFEQRIADLQAYIEKLRHVNVKKSENIRVFTAFAAI